MDNKCDRLVAQVLRPGLGIGHICRPRGRGRGGGRGEDLHVDVLSLCGIRLSDGGFLRSDNNVFYTGVIPLGGCLLLRQSSARVDVEKSGMRV